MYRQNQTLVRLLQPVIETMGYELLGIEHGSRGHGDLLRIYIDHEAGITLEDCERVSEQVSGILDVEDPLQRSYTLEVSSPGLDRPLFSLGQFEDYIGHEAQIRLRQMVNGRRRLRGLIDAVEDGTVILQVDGEPFRIEADLIEHARLIPDF
jgi:ribosome maturation factor RimP